MYNMTAIEAGNNFLEIAKAANTASSGAIMSLVMLVIFVVILISFKRYNFKAVFLVDSFITSLIAVLAFVNEFISMQIMIIPILLLLGSIIAYFFVE